MSRLFPIFGILALVLFQPLEPARADEEGASRAISAEALQCFEWFDALGFPDVKDAPWAEVWTGWVSHSFGAQPRSNEDSTYGFVISTNATEFTLLEADLKHTTFIRGAEPATNLGAVRFEVRSLPAAANAMLEQRRRELTETFQPHGGRIGAKAETFVLAHACWRMGELQLAKELFDVAKKLDAKFRPASGSTQTPSMVLDLECDIGNAAMWKAVVDFGEPVTKLLNGVRHGVLKPRTELLAEFREVARLYPHSQHFARATQTVAVLERMVAEDAQRRPITAAEITKLPQKEQIAELIYQLRDQNSELWMGGRPDLFDPFTQRSEKSAAARLLEVGQPAVPQLLEALADDRFTRSVSCHRSFRFSHHVLTVGDCALEILRQISGRWFESIEKDDCHVPRAAGVAHTRKQVEAWWAEIQGKGEEQSLVDAIADGGDNPDMIVRRLKKVDASAVESAVYAGAVKATNVYRIQTFIKLIAPYPSSNATAWLQRTMNNGPTVDVRLDAAWQLRDRNATNVLPAMIAEWKKLPLKNAWLPEGFEGLAEFLVASGDAEAMRTLLVGWDARRIYERYEIVKTLAQWLAPDWRTNNWHDHVGTIPSPAALDLAEEFLVHALEDADIREGTSGGFGGYSFTCPRICDVALVGLHRALPARYSASLKDTRRQRDTERIAAANIWRRNHKRPELPVPEYNRPQLEPERSLTITSVRITPAPPETAAALTKTITDLNGTTFTARTVPEILLNFAKSSSAGLCGIWIEAIRDDDLGGVHLEAQLHPGTFPTKGDWQISHSGKVGESGLGMSSGTYTVEYGGKNDRWNRFIHEVEPLLHAAAPEAPFEIRASLTTQK